MNQPPEQALVLPAGAAESIVRTASLLREGGVAVVPTDTVYGLAASVFRPSAIERVFAIKQRAPDAAVPVLLAGAADLPVLTDDVPREAWRLIRHFWPGALTLVFPARRSLSPLLTGGGSTVAVRVPAGRGILQLLETLGEPIVGTSANVHGEPPALSAADAAARLGSLVDVVLEDDGAVTAGQASTVVEIRDDEYIVHRAGAIDLDAIRRVAGMLTLTRRADA